MKSAKKLVLGLLVLAVTCGCVVGCGGKDAKEAIADMLEPSPGKTSKPLATESYEDDDYESNEFEAGISTSRGYENEWIGLRFTPYGDIEMSTRSELEQAMGIGKDVLGQDEYSTSNSQYYYEMMAGTEGGDNINIMAVKDPTGFMTEEDYLDDIRSQLEGQSTIQYVFEDNLITKNVAGVSFEGFSCYGTVYLDGEKKSMSQLMLVHKKGDWFYVITVSCSGVDETDEFLACFSRI